jgi:epoxyqueuosine reductase
LGVDLAESIKSFALNEAGFDLVGITSAELPVFHETALSSWIENGYAGSMEYMERAPERRAHPRARSVIALAVNYYHPEDSKPADFHTPGKVAKYAYGADYHKLIEKKLKKLSYYVLTVGGADTQVKGYVDTGPLLERAFAQRAGLGFFGKNTNIITRNFGSWVFLACLITNLELDQDAPHAGSCGSCRICLDACPTGALLGNYTLDATRCISYLTIESKDPVPERLRAGVGEWAFGCDICQDVCPYNFRAKTTRHEELYPLKKAGTWLDLANVEILPGSPLKRAKKLKTRQT